MDQIDRMTSSSSGDSGDRVAKASKGQHGPAMAAQDLPPQPTLKCPRCDSSNTKFCYYNNYSQTQPRHFCKSCRRYWTQGGTLRNVPVGGGCRKNKRVRPRSLISMGGLDHGPTSFSDATSNMLGRLSSIPSFSNGSDDTGSQLLNIAFSRFQESMRLRQQSAQSSEGVHFSDMSLPGLVHKPCGLSSCAGGSACANRTSLHLDGACTGSLLADGFDNNLGFSTLHGGSGYCSSSYEMANPVHVYTQAPKMHDIMMGTSATATLATIEDELSSFSNLQYHSNSFNAGDAAAQEQKDFDFRTGQRLLSGLPHGGSGHLSYMDQLNTDLSNTHTEEQKPANREDKPLINMSGDSGLSLMMPADTWQQQPPSSMNEVLFEPHHSMMWSTNASRWPDMHPATAAAGSVL